MKDKMLEIKQNLNLANYTTMKLGGAAQHFATLNDEAEIPELMKFAKNQNLPIFILGGGSNTIVGDAGFADLVIKNEILGRKIAYEDETSVEFDLGAGENWDKFVHYAVDKKNLSGAEAMVMIPGTVGALPIQNVGAYGQETSDIFVSLKAYNLETGKFETLDAEACEFGYRDSIFRAHASGKYIITSVRLKLFKKPPTPPYYAAIEKYFTDRDIALEDVTTQEIMNAVVKIRSNKLPNPNEIASSGSFFKNAIITSEKASELRQEFGENIPLFALENGDYKIATGWMIDKAGLRGKMIHGMRPHSGNALVLTNISAKNYADLAAARTEIQQKVFEKFGIKIEQEPLEI